MSRTGALSRGAAQVTALSPAALRGLVGLVLLSAVVACTKGTPTSEPLASAALLQPPEVRTVATASVLITERPEEYASPVTTVQITPNSIVVDPGEGVQLSAEAFGADGAFLSDIDLIWASSDLRAGTVGEDGLFQAGTRPGVYEDAITVTGIQNTVDGIKFAGGFATVTVVGETPVARLAAVTMVPEDPSLMNLQIFRMRAIGFDEEGTIIPATSFVWRLNDPRVGRLNEIGYLTVDADEGAYPQAVMVTGIWEGEKVSVTTGITVVGAPEEDYYLQVHALPRTFYIDPGDRLRLSAVALNGLGELAVGTELRWSMKDLGAGAIDGKGNFVAGETPGVYTEAVRVEAVVPGETGFVRSADFASVVIRARPVTPKLSAVSVSPAIIVAAPGSDMNLTVRAVDQYGDPAEEVTISWEAVEPSAGEVSGPGRFKAGFAPGYYPEAMRATVEQHLDDGTISLSQSVKVVITGALTRTEVGPALATVAPNRTAHFSISGWDENDILLPGLIVIWSVSDDAIGHIDNFGNFTAANAPGLYSDAIRAEVVQKLPFPP